MVMVVRFSGTRSCDLLYESRFHRLGAGESAGADRMMRIRASASMSAVLGRLLSKTQMALQRDSDEFQDERYWLGWPLHPVTLLIRPNVVRQWGVRSGPQMKDLDEGGLQRIVRDYGLDSIYFVFVPIERESR